MQELDYIEVRTTEPRDEHTRGECVSSTKRGKAGTLQSMPTYEGCSAGTLQSMHKRGCIREGCRGSTKYTTLGPSDTRSQSY
jgi:hypothetical protein